MKYAIVGAVANGMLPAYLLKKAGHDVQVVTEHEEQAASINEQGIIHGKDRQYIKAYTDIEQIDPDAFILLTVKYEDLQPILRLLKIRCPSNRIVFLQQGMLFLEKARTLSHRHIAAAVLETDCVKLSNTEISFSKTAHVTYGLVKGHMEEFQPLLESSAWQTNWVETIEEQLFESLLFSSLIDPLTALMKIRNGELITNPHAYELFRNLYNELYLAFPEIESLQPIEKVAAFCAAEPERASAMLTDRLAGDPMEVEGLMLYVLNRSKLELPLFKAFYHLLKTVEVEK
ncbi:ketopantoate reductase C-terminal domain-containing protein [Microbacterium sp. APC 3898]|uniref:Ketopantoate reductase C-terminal domain-containing protein n=1 Tax=Planococcus notacanthi TaxID=3035188 RepID=A0ABT7ZFY8_9BACL|nr:MULTISPECIES: ketopantoate reductase C-terminal domain-containing protein [Terrabacteria group]MDN3426065.1 ketopantoate reductase C-terminal domain-containing protein [Planococcus sp. APC 4016]MDN3497762.1 ketopantoate reductase C-terminal domain-containing protein [Microbacterium sp. APC 3898]